MKQWHKSLNMTFVRDTKFCNRHLSSCIAIKKKWLLLYIKWPRHTIFLIFPRFLDFKIIISLRLVSGFWSFSLNVYSDMFLPTHTPVFSLFLFLSFSLSLSLSLGSSSSRRSKYHQRQEQQSSPVATTALRSTLCSFLQRTATNFAIHLFLLVLCYTVTCGLFDCLPVFAGLLLRVTPFVLYNTYIYIRRSARFSYVLLLASYLSLSSVAGNLS